jgi:hypothetical protein
VIGFYRIVRVLLGVLPCHGNQLIENGGVDRRGIGDDLARRYLQGPQCSDEEPARGRGVATGREQNVDDLAVLIDPPDTRSATSR